MSTYQKLDDAALVRRALEGSQQGYAELVRRYEGPVYSLILRMVRDAALAEDLAQEAFLKAFSALDRFDAKRKLSSWLFKIAHNTTLDHLRRRRPSTVPIGGNDEGEAGLEAVLVDSSVESPLAAAERGDLGRDLDLALARIRVDYRELLVLRYQEGLSYNEIAEITRLPLGTVKTHLHRGRKEMATVLAEMGYGQGSTETHRGRDA